MYDPRERLLAALASEEVWQREVLAAARARPWAEQVATGVAWPVMRVEDTQPAGRDRQRWTLRLPRGVLPDAIGAGDAIEVGPAGAVHLPWRGRVESRDDRVAEITVRAEDEPPAEVRVALAFDASTFRRYRSALLARPERKLGKILVGQALWETPEPAVFDRSGLHPAQADAVAQALGTDALAAIWGPPGTGKTVTLVALLRALVAEGERPWALADSNAAVDHLAVRAADAGLRVVRVGSPARIGHRAAGLSLDAALAQHAHAGAIRAIDKELRRLWAKRGPEARDARRALLGDRERLVAEARAQILASAQVIAVTFGTLARVAPDLPPARTAVVDEATQAMEPAVWVAVPWVERLVLAGDPEQLGPVVMEPNNPLGDSLLQRLLRERRIVAPMLTEQHRMSAELGELVRGVYGADWHAAPSMAGARLAGLSGVAEDALTTTPTLWIDTAGAGVDESKDAASGSTENRGEAELVGRVVARWRALGVHADTIGVIAPYRAQVVRLQADPRLAGVEVATVNAFQGREKEAVVVSFCRSNVEGEVGFVGDRRRLVVSLTRAKRALVLVGDSATVGRLPLLAEVLDRLAADGAIVSVWEPDWSLDGA